MPVQGSGQISADDIRDEFGPLNGSVSFDDYRVSEDHGSLQNMPLDQRAGANQDTDIPSSGAIRFSNFYNGKLNVVTRIREDDRSARNEYDNNRRTDVVGGLRGRPTANNMGGRKVFINVNDDIGGDNDNVNINYVLSEEGGQMMLEDVFQVSENKIILGSNDSILIEDQSDSDNYKLLNMDMGRFDISVVANNESMTIQSTDSSASTTDFFRRSDSAIFVSRTEQIV